MLIWGTVFGSAVGALTGAWLALILVRAGKAVQRGALIALLMAVLGGAAVMTDSFDWPKTSGTPVVRYELRLPPGTLLPDRSNVDLTVWTDHSGQGCYIDNISASGDRPEIAGNLVLQTTNLHPTMSLRLNGTMEGYWELPIKPDAPLDKTFGPWQRINFIASPRLGLPPLPLGDYEIRYRVRKYM
jgi:hypothetical protein